MPDHGGLRPWRFAVIRGSGRDRFAEALVAGLFELRGADVPDGALVKMRGKAFAAPCAVMLVASPRLESNVPEWEQVVSASCTGYAVVLGATALGLGAVWKSAHVLDTEPVRTLFGVADHERLLGWVNLGSPGVASRKKSPADAEEPFPRITVIGRLIGVPVTGLGGRQAARSSASVRVSSVEGAPPRVGRRRDRGSA